MPYPCKQAKKNRKGREETHEQASRFRPDRTRASAGANLIAREADEIERTRRLTPPVVSALIENGLYRALLPKSAGGAEAPLEVFMQMLEEVAKADASTAWCLGQCSVCAMTAAYLDPDHRHARCLARRPTSWPGVRSPARCRWCPAAIVPMAAGTSPAAPARPTGSALMSRSWKRMARDGGRATARWRSAPSCFRSRAPRCTTSGT